jgi:RNA polymerase sigma-70 factor (ECF subfamily)
MPGSPAIRDGVSPASGPSDAELVARLAAGDREALEPLVERHQRRLYRLALGYLRNPEDALDVVQETFVKAYLHAGRRNEGPEVAAWLTRIAINQAIDRYRRERHRRRFMEPLADETPLAASAMASSPERALGSREIGEQVAAAVQSLPERQRAVFLLRHREDMALDEISRTLGLNLGTVKSTLHRAIARLRVRLGEAKP